MYVMAAIEHHSGRIRVLGATAHPTASWVPQAARNLVMDLQDAQCRARYLIRNRDGKSPELFDAVMADAGLTDVLTGVRMPRMNALMQRWVQACRRELLDRTGTNATCCTHCVSSTTSMSTNVPCDLDGCNSRHPQLSRHP
jgi:putative transposase